MTGVSGAFWRGRRVFVTGHTGFKGSWLVTWLANMKAAVKGYALPPWTSPSLFEAIDVAARCEHDIGDIRDAERLARSLKDFSPEVVFHLAAQPLVRPSYREPLLTMATNVQGTANLLEACRGVAGLKSIVIITTDKCYEEQQWTWGYRESDRLGGFDPYSASKACAELVTASYRNSFFKPTSVTVVTARAGNVLGGGDWGEDRIVADAARAFAANRELVVRNASAVRPWQHVLDPLAGYLLLAERGLSAAGSNFEGAWNFGPEGDGLTVGTLVTALAARWGGSARWRALSEVGAPHEAQSLRLDCSRARQTLGWRPRLGFVDTIDWTAEWYLAHSTGASAGALKDLTESQIARFTQRD